MDRFSGGYVSRWGWFLMREDWRHELLGGAFDGEIGVSADGSGAGDVSLDEGLGSVDACDSAS